MAKAKELVRGGLAIKRWVDGGRKLHPRRSWQRLADTIGVSYQTLYDWARGTFSPRPEHRELLRIWAGIAPEVWETSEERARTRENAKRLRDARAGIAPTVKRSRSVRAGAVA